MISALVETRMALHAIAEQILAGDLHRHTGRIGLREVEGGFGQPEYLVGGERRRLRVEGADLVVLRGDVETWYPLRTLAGVARDADTVVGGPSGSYLPETSLEPDAPLRIDALAARDLHQVFTTSTVALHRFRRHHRDRYPTIVQLWPEHFDLAFSMSEVNFGVSPGDAVHDEPYGYVGPWVPRPGAWWNEPWGRSIPWADLANPDAAVAFFERGLEEATAR